MNSLIQNVNKIYKILPKENKKIKDKLFAAFDNYKNNDWKKYIRSTDRGIEEKKHIIEKNKNYNLYINIFDKKNKIKIEENFHLYKVLKGDILYTNCNQFKLKDNTVILSEKNNIFSYKTCEEDCSFILVLEDKKSIL